MVDRAILGGVCSSLIFVVLNVAMNLYMKWLFAPHGGNFAYPWTMLSVQQLQAYMVLQPWIAIKFPSKRCGWDMNEDGVEGMGMAVSLQVLAVTLLFCLNVGLNSLSLVRISITLNQTVRAFLPVGVLVLASVLEQRTYPRHSYVTTAVLVLGIALTCWGSPDFELFGFSLAMASTLMAALGTSLNGRLLSAGPFSKAGPEKIARLMMLQSVPAFFIFSAIAMLTEGQQLLTQLQGQSIWEVQKMLGLISISSGLALMANLGRCFLVAATSALMETLAGNAKVAALCIIDHHLFGTVLIPYNYVGIALTFGGFSVHVLLQYASRQPPEAATDAKVDQADSATAPLADNKGLPGRRSLEPVSRQKPPSLPSMISGGETGLASEHLALRFGKPPPAQRRKARLSVDEMFHGARAHASTWHAGSDPTTTWLDRVGTKMGMDLAPVLEAPPWLADDDTESEVGTQEGDWLVSPSLASSSHRSQERFDRFEPMALPSLPPSGSSRNRIWSDITHSAGTLPPRGTPTSKGTLNPKPPVSPKGPAAPGPKLPVTLGPEPQLGPL